MDEDWPAMLDMLRCWVGAPRWIPVDPHGGDPELGGSVVIVICAACHTERWAHR